MARYAVFRGNGTAERQDFGDVMKSLRKTRLGLSDVEVTQLGVGCWAWGDQEYWNYGANFGPKDVVGAFTASVKAGITLFDTAESYGWGKSEQLLGALARRCDRDLVVATKYAPLAGRGGPRAIERGLELSLRRLSRVDLYQLHWADRDEAPIEQVMEVLAEAKKAGRIGAVGISNFNEAEMRQAYSALERHGVPLASNQMHYSLLHRSPEVDGVLAACRELNVTLLAYSPLEQGLLCGKYDVAHLPPGKRAGVPWFSRENVYAARPVVEMLEEIGKAHEKSAAAVAIAWLLAQPGVVPLPGARNEAQAIGNSMALEISLSGEELAELDGATVRWRVPS